jgi:hypothetical protein
VPRNEQFDGKEALLERKTLFISAKERFWDKVMGRGKCWRDETWKITNHLIICIVDRYLTPTLFTSLMHVRRTSVQSGNGLNSRNSFIISIHCLLISYFPFMIKMGSTTLPQHKAWWKESSVYQIYPASFKDSNNDGIGDLEGVISKVDYLDNLGVECVWLSPILKSPQVDMGYDISDYKVIDPQYGNLDDVDRLTKELNSRGMKLIMDLVVNHTSDQHEWFKKSRSSKDSEYRDWYIWRKARYDEHGNRQPPNNWAAAFQGSVWEWDEATQEYYLHIFAVEQPDLNCKLRGDPNTSSSEVFAKNVVFQSWRS